MFFCVIIYLFTHDFFIFRNQIFIHKDGEKTDHAELPGKRGTENIYLGKAFCVRIL